VTPDIAICLAILAATVALIAWDRIPADVVAIGVMLALVATGLLTPQVAFAGFASDTVMMILGLLIMTAGLIQTGVVELAGRWLFELAGRSPAVFLPAMMVSAAVVSAFMSNTAATAVLVPLVLGYATKTATSASRYLLPLAFASILTSSVTLISTSTNLVVSDLLGKYGQAPMGMFELAPAGLPIAIVGILYVWLVGVRLMPQRADQVPEADIGERTYQADMLIAEDGPLAGKTLADAKLTPDFGYTVVKHVRGDVATTGTAKLAGIELATGDELFVEGLRADLLKFKDMGGLKFKADVTLARPETASEEKEIVEGVLLPNSPLLGYSLSRLGFKERYGLDVLAIHRAGRLPSPISAARLRMGDVLLLQGTPQNVKRLEEGNLFNIFGGVPRQRLNRTMAPFATAIFAAAIAAATLGLASLPFAMLAGAFAMLVARCLSPDEAYAHVEWKLLILIGALFSLGTAMEATGTGRYLAQALIGIAGAQSTYLLLSCFFLLTVALTQPMSNQAAALVVFPIAMQTAIEIGANPRSFAMIVAVAASCSYLTPLEPSCLMVYGPGKYRFSDFAKVGTPLTVLIYLLAIVLVPLIWPL
jgi:di/tricarboxylate transporter